MEIKKSDVVYEILFYLPPKDGKSKIIKMGISLKYTDKNEMYLSAKFM